MASVSPAGGSVTGIPTVKTALMKTQNSAVSDLLWTITLPGCFVFCSSKSYFIQNLVVISLGLP